MALLPLCPAAMMPCCHDALLHDAMLLSQLQSFYVAFQHAYFGSPILEDHTLDETE